MTNGLQILIMEYASKGAAGWSCCALFSILRGAADPPGVLFCQVKEKAYVVH